jgi:phosphoribosylformylglycinamidine synthase
LRQLLGPVPCTELGTVTSGAVTVGGQAWGNIAEWKEKYDTAIETLLAKEEAGGALSMI